MTPELRHLAGSAPPLATIPTAEPDGGQDRPTLRRPVADELVKSNQTKLRLNPDGDFGPNTEAAVRAFQRTEGLVPDGIVGPKTLRRRSSLPRQDAQNKRHVARHS
jgi:peptidoglycan hydrolase-like protein with peptidoglycan-binding domain